jgi:alpha-1,6-mannosyltransferase
VTTVSSPPAAPAARDRVLDRAASFGRQQLPSVIVGGLLLAFFVVAAVRLPWANDLMLHMAVLRRLMDDPLHPGDPVIHIGGSSIYYSPYMVALALLGKASGLSAYTMLKLAAVVNVVLLVSGLYRFVRTLSQARWAPPLAMIGLLFWWGTKVIGFSGFLSFISLNDTQAYPSTLATALTLHLWAWLNDGGRTLRSPWRALGIGVLLGLILLTHQFTGLSAIVGSAAILVARHRIVRTKAALTSLALGLVACALVVAVWPYYHLWSVNQGELDDLDPIHHALYAEVATWYGMGILLGLVALALRFVRNKTDALVLMFAGIGAVVVYGKVTEHWSYGRSWPVLMLVAQVAVAIALAEAVHVRTRWAWGVPVALATAIGAWTQFNGSLDNLPRLNGMAKYFTSNTVVAASEPDAMYEAAAHGSYGVTAAWYLPEIPRATQNQRNAAVRAIFSPRTSAAERTALLEKYDVTWVLLAPHQPLPHGLPATLTARESGYRLYKVTYTH